MLIHILVKLEALEGQSQLVTVTGREREGLLIFKVHKVFK